MRAERQRLREAEALAPPARLPGKLGLAAALISIWWCLYQMLPGLARFGTRNVLKLDPASSLGASVEFFLYDTPKILLLLALVVFAVGVARSFFSPARTRRLLAGRGEVAGNVLAALLGVITPFCSCSAVPLFEGFLGAGVPLGVTFSFLIAAPMVNEIAVVLLYGLLGWQVAALYLAAGLFVAMAAGFVIGRLRLERFVEDAMLAARAESGQGVETAGEAGEAGAPAPDWAARLDAGGRAVRGIVGRVWIWVVAGIAVGAGIHGYAPAGLLASVMGGQTWWSVPVAVVVGIPMYANVAGIVPVVYALLEKGAALGTVLALMMSVIALSLPALVILRKALKARLIVVFAVVVGLGILLMGYLFNAML
ncbi:MAG: hypothetical protein AUJ49_00545 [Desulfovibrionaceae bacterium CG1_02_65_16]|nr:MAG: hypothetical protein AUJ49_00545 [Desulfovibrionaceae bacterium CG1_02_65_16]